MLDLRALGHFVAIHETGSISGAAQRRRIAQPSITNALETLEAALGRRLFDRSKRGCAPTAEGDLLYCRAVALLAQARAITTEFAAADEADALRLHVEPDILLPALRDFIAGLREERPRLRLSFHQGPAEADLSVVALGAGPAPEGFQLLWREEFVLAAPAAHPLRFQGLAGLAMLDGIDFIDRPRCARAAWFRATLDAAGIAPVIVAHAASEEQALALLRMGAGAAILPESHVPKGAEDISARRFLPELTVSRSVGFVAGPAARAAFPSLAA